MERHWMECVRFWLNSQFSSLLKKTSGDTQGPFAASDLLPAHFLSVVVICSLIRSLSLAGALPGELFDVVTDWGRCLSRPGKGYHPRLL